MAVSVYSFALLRFASLQLYCFSLFVADEYFSVELYTQYNLCFNSRAYVLFRSHFWRKFLHAVVLYNLYFYTPKFDKKASYAPCIN